ncbi:MAG: DUF3570 domain-containing protein [Pseudomonadota bacterium]
MAVTEHFSLTIVLLGLVLVSLPTGSTVLPEDRADVMYHGYDGGGVEVSGPSILLRKSVGDSVSISGNYYVDSISSASIDVVTSASPYTEERKEKSLSVDYLRNKTLMSLAYTDSDESDYAASTFSLGISQDLFGDLTTVTLGYAVGNDEVRNNSDSSFSESADRQNFRLGLTQILTKNSLLAVNWETITDQGYLNNPYRSVRYLDGDTYLTEPEVYPNTRTSNALALRLRYYLPYRAALGGEYRYFNDTWGITAHNAELGYTHPLRKDWIFELKYRYYTQGAADFYSDLFAYEGEQNFRARDKELSTFNSHTLGFALSYEIAKGGWRFVDRGSLNLSYDYIRFEYEDFRDLTSSTDVGEEPLYSFSASVWKAYLSIWY